MPRSGAQDPCSGINELDVIEAQLEKGVQNIIEVVEKCAIAPIVIHHHNIQSETDAPDFVNVEAILHRCTSEAHTLLNQASVDILATHLAYRSIRAKYAAERLDPIQALDFRNVGHITIAGTNEVTPAAIVAFKLGVLMQYFAVAELAYS